MTPDSYKVNVITYLNPHQIWVSSDGKENILFEQIGVYGILPLEKTLVLEDNYCDVMNVQCEDWRPAAAAIMTGLLKECEEIWFWPTFFSSRTSIFDNNIHTYGEIKIKLKNGKLKKLSKELIKSGFAYGNVCEFHERLTCGKIKSKLDKTQTQEILKQLEDYCLSKEMQKALEMQTSVLRDYQMLELYITESFLQKHTNEQVKKILIDKNRDFELCKGLDEISVGRACRRNKPIPYNGESEVTINCSKPKSDVTNLNLTVDSQSETTVCSKINMSVRNENKENWLTRKLKLLSILESKNNNVVEPKVEENNNMNIETSLKSTKNIEMVTDDDLKIEEKSIKNMINKINNFNSRGTPSQVEQETKSRNDLVEPKEIGSFVDKTNSIYQFHSKMCSIEEENTKLHKTAKVHAKHTGTKSDAKTHIAFGPPEMDIRLFKIQHITVPAEEEEYHIQETDIGKAALSKKDKFLDEIDLKVGIGSMCTEKEGNENKENFLTRKLRIFKSLEKAKKDVESV